jgi:hypothetical protein
MLGATELVRCNLVRLNLNLLPYLTSRVDARINRMTALGDPAKFPPQNQFSGFSDGGTCIHKYMEHLRSCAVFLAAFERDATGLYRALGLAWTWIIERTFINSCL